MKTTKNIRVTETIQNRVKAYQRVHNVKTEKEALEKLIMEAVHTLLYLQYFLDHRDATKEEPPCLRRFMYDGKFWCGLRAPKMYEIETLELCKACKLKVILNVERQQEEPPLVSAGSSETQDIRPKKFEVKQVYCSHQGGLWVVKSACDACKNQCDKRWNFT